jgi:hypothetical protein
MIKMAKKILLSVLVLAVVLSGSIFVTQLSATTPVEASEKTPNTISVLGKGTITMDPDMAYVSLGVQTENKDAKLAQEENSKKMEKVIASIKKLGIQEKDIKTSGFNMYPNYVYNKEDGSTREIDKYVVTHTLEITVRDIDMVGKVIDTGINQGVNLSNSIRFTISNPDEAYQQALVAALKDAKAKADVLATAIGVKVTTPKSVIEQGAYNIPYNYTTAEKVAFDTADSVSMPVEAGELEVIANINVIYEY